MAEFLLWPPYQRALVDGDFRDLIKAIEDGDPRVFYPVVVRLLAETVAKNPPPPNRKTKLRDSLPWADLIRAEMAVDEGKAWGKLTRAMDRIHERHRNKSIDALKDHWSEYLRARREHDAID